MASSKAIYIRKGMLIVEIPEGATGVVCFTRLQNPRHFTVKHEVSLTKALP
jgi:hypothetical protein